MPELNWLAVGVAFVANFFLSGLWYGLFAKPWMAELGFSMESIKNDPWPMPAYPFAIVASAVSAIGLAILLKWAGVTDIGLALLIAAALGLIVALNLGKHAAFSKKTWRLFLIDGGSDIVGFAAMGPILVAIN